MKCSRHSQGVPRHFGRGNFFLEIQDQGLELEKKIHADLFRLEKDLDIPLVATNDSHYLCEDDRTRTRFCFACNRGLDQ